VIAITGKPEKGFWRSGVFHTNKRTLHADDKFSPQGLALLRKEPNLVVEVGLPNPKPEQPEPKK
jgi:hypothetical protein